MTRVVVDRAAVDTLRRALARERRLLEVVEEGGEADWRPVSGARPFDWAPPVSLGGAKRFFFPPREPLLRWQGQTVAETSPPAAPFVLFGVRPCDLAAITYQDRFFADDPWYVRRRADALLVGLDCLAACEGGFCLDVDAGPFARAGFDLNLTPLDGDRVSIVAGTDRGRDVIAAARLPWAPADAASCAAFDAAEARARASFERRAFVRRGIARVSHGEVHDDEWQALGPACLACTGCTNVCPTCSCFTVVDEPSTTDAGTRVRVWDSCLLEGFQREASGHHPAPAPGDRVRRFWYHKLSDDFVPSCRRIGCVGCGRCDVTCPTSIGALAVLRRVGT